MTKGEHIGVVGVYTEAETTRLTGVSLRQLRYWDRTSFFVPGLAAADRSKPFSRLYGFRDLVSLRVLDRLRNEARVPLPHLRQVKDRLAALGDDLWSVTTLFVHDRRVAFVNPDTRTLEEVVSGQGILEISIAVSQADMADAVQRLRTRRDEDVGQIARKRGVIGNQPVVAGTRIPVRSIQAFAQAGYDVAEIKRNYPTLRDADVEAALAYESVA